MGLKWAKRRINGDNKGRKHCFFITYLLEIKGLSDI